MSMMSCYAGGVFLATCFLDALPDVNENFRKFQKTASWNTQYPVAEFFVCIGIFLIYILEEGFAKLLAKTDENIVGREIKVVKLTNGKETDSVQETEPLEVYQAIKPNELSDSSDIEITRRNGTSSVVASGILHSITFTIAMSFHSVLEGVALGVQDEKIGIVTLFISLLLHKGIEAFSVGLQISRTIAQRAKLVIATITVYSLMTPVGSVGGLFLQSANIYEPYRQGIIFVLEALAIGTFFYVTFFEVLGEERHNTVSKPLQILAIAAGFLTIAAFQYFEQVFRDSSHKNPEH